MLTSRMQDGIIDLIGGAIVVACVVVFCRTLAGGSEVTRDEIANLNHAISEASAEVSSLRTEVAVLRDVLSGRRGELEASGQLPADAPVDEYFQKLSAGATQRGLRVLRHHSLSPRTYPGLLEQRYVFEVAGTTQSVVGFLEMIEQSDYWADVSYLVVNGSGGAGGRRTSDPDAGEATRQATLTISLFSAPAAESPQRTSKDT